MSENQNKDAQRKRPSFTRIAALFVLVPVAYVLSYAAVFHLVGEPDDGVNYPPRASWQEIYVPVEWLTDNTPLREPLLFWAGLWGKDVEHDFRLRSDRRRRGRDPYPTWTDAFANDFFFDEASP